MMDSLTVVTNNRPRLILDWDQLTERERRYFDYLDEDERVGRGFIRYRGVAYDLGEFMVTSDDLREWEGYASETYFSGVVVRYCEDDRDRVVMGRYYA